MLANLAQIKGGLKLREDVDSLLNFQRQLSATQIITTIVKDDTTNPVTNWNVDDILKAIIDSSEIDGANKVTLATLNTALSNFKDKQIKDVVRVQLAAVKEEEPNEGFTVDVTGVDSGLKVAANDALPVYTTDGRVVYADAGITQLTINLSTGAFPVGAVPQVMVDNTADRTQNETEVGVTHYTALDDDFNFKVFATGTFTLNTLPTDALLDNQEMQSLAYDQAIDKIVLKLASDEDIIASISALVGQTAVQQQIESVTNTLYRYSAIQGTPAVEESGTEGEDDYVAPVAAETITANTHVYSANRVDQLITAATAHSNAEIDKKHNFAAINTAVAAEEIAVVSTIGQVDYVAPQAAVVQEAPANANTPVDSSAVVTSKINAAIKASLEDVSAAIYAVDAKTYDFAHIVGAQSVAAVGEEGQPGYVAAVPAETVTETTAVYSKAAVDQLFSGVAGQISDALTTTVKLTQLVGGAQQLGEDGVTVTRAAEQISQSTQVYTKQAVDDAIEAATGDMLTNALAYSQENAARIDAVQTACVPVIDEIAISSASAVTSFNLTATPNATKVKMFINGATYWEGEEFTVDRTNNTVAWTFTAQTNLDGTPVSGHEEGVDGFTITNALTNKVRFEYYTGTFVTRTVPVPTPASPEPSGD